MKSVIMFLLKWVMLWATLWFSIWASRFVCCSTFTAAEHPAGMVAAMSQPDFTATFKECLFRY